MNSCSLRTVFESVNSGQMPLAPQRVCRIAMRITDANNRSIVPPHDLIQQAHQIGVGDQCSNFRFLNRHEIEVCFETLQSDVISSEVEAATQQTKSERPGFPCRCFNLSTWCKP